MLNIILHALKQLNMKKAIILMLLATLASCTYIGPPSSITSDKWLEVEMRPSVITYDGEIFYATYLSGGRIGVYYDSTVSEDGSFYYHRLMQDYGWFENTKGGWSANESYKRTRAGYIYINPAKRAAVYFNPSTDKYSAFKVIIY